MKTTRRYSYYQGGSKACTVFVHGIFSSKETLENLTDQLGNHSCIFFNLFEIANDLKKYDLESISLQIIETLDELNISDTVFVSSCIGKPISFCIGIQRPDLIKGQIFIGNIEEEIDPSLKQAQLSLFKYLKGREREVFSIPTLRKLMNMEDQSDADLYAGDLLSNIEQESFEELYESIHGKVHFSKMDYQSNTIPNVLIVPKDSKKPFFLKNKPGFNLSIVKVRGASNEYGMIRSSLFTSELRRSVNYLS